MVVSSAVVPRGTPIVETVVTTLERDGTPNCAAMGVTWGEDELLIRPWSGTRTLRNLRDRPAAVVHLTDDVLLFCEAALGRPTPPTVPAEAVAGAVIADACSWREVVVDAIDDEGERATARCRVVARGAGREALGLNRARHAAVEASILVSRVGVLDDATIDARLAPLHELVEKTAGPRERAAMAYVLERLDARRARLAERAG